MVQCKCCTFLQSTDTVKVERPGEGCTHYCTVTLCKVLGQSELSYKAGMVL